MMEEDIYSGRVCGGGVMEEGRTQWKSVVVV